MTTQRVSTETWTREPGFPVLNDWHQWMSIPDNAQAHREIFSFFGLLLVLIFYMSFVIYYLYHTYYYCDLFYISFIFFYVVCITYRKYYIISYNLHIQSMFNLL